MNSNLHVRIRIALIGDIPVLSGLIEASVLGLQTQDYTLAQMEGALKTVYGVDTQLIADGTYFIAEVDVLTSATINADCERIMVGCGGWSKRKTLFGGDRWKGREDDLLDPNCDAAKIRAFFVHPKWARQGIGSMILQTCEAAAKAAGFKRFEIGATLTGVPMYKARGYLELESIEVPLANGESLPIVRMVKNA